LGDLPYTLSWITPIAITGQIGYAIPARNFTATFGRGVRGAGEILRDYR